MSTKKFKLPKEFAKSWIEALRSGKYTQGEGYLQQFIDTNESELKVENCAYCCLGVAALVCNVDLKELSTEFIHSENQVFKSVPLEIKGNCSSNDFVKLVSILNDGLYERTFGIYFKDPSLIFREAMHSYRVLSSDDDDFKLSFNQIADFIEDNCEFY